MSNVPSIFAPPPGSSSGSNNNNYGQQQQQPPPSSNSSYGGYQPSPAASAGGYVPRAAAGGSGGGYTPSAAAGGSGGYVPSAAASAGGYTPSAAAGGSSGGYVPSAAAGGGGYVPSAAASASSGGYVPSAAASTSTASSSYVPSAAASASNVYVPSAAASASQVYSPTTTTMTPATRSNNNINNNTAYNPSQSQTTSAAAPYKSTDYAASTTSTAVPHAVANPMKSYQPGNGPTHGVMSQSIQPVKCHKVDYEIRGQEMQLVEIHLDPGETVIAEAGAMMYLEPDVDFKTKFGDGSEPKQGFFKKLMAGAGRLMTGESLFITHFTNRGNQIRKAAFAAPYPGTILALDMALLQQQYPTNIPDKQLSLVVQKDAFLCAAKGTKLEMTFNKKLGSGLFGGEGFILQKLKGDGMAFCHAGGCVIERHLKPGEKLRVDTGCLVGFTSPGINYSIEAAPGLKTMFFGGEGLFLVTLEGEGTVWLQSLPFSRLADRVLAYAPSAGGRRQGEGSALMGGFGGLIDGDGFGAFQ